MKTIACVLTFYAVLALGQIQPAAAQHCRPPSRIIYRGPAYHAPFVHHAPAVVVKKEIAVVKEVAVPRFLLAFQVVDFPSYGAQFLPPVAAPVQPVQQPPQQQQSDMAAIMGALKQINDNMKAFDDRLKKLEQAAPKKPVDPFEPQAQRRDDRSPPTALAVVKNKCAACHSEAKAGEEGGGFVMLDKDGALPAFSQKQRDRILAKAYKGAMPPRDNKLKIAPLSDDEVATLASLGK